jgi:6-phosphogluconolactonase
MQRRIWLVVSSDGRFAYMADASTAHVSQYHIASNGARSLVGNGNNASTPDGPVDRDLSNGDGFLYMLNARSGAITGFSVNPPDGALASIGGPAGLGLGWSGVIAV